MTNRTKCLALFALIACAGLSACDTAPKSEGGKVDLSANVKSTITSFTSADSTLRELMDKSIGYAVFPEVGKAGFIAGGSYGRGEVFEGGKRIGYTDVTQGTIGLQAGAESFDEMIIFLTPEQMDKFKSNQFAFSANLSAVIIQSGAARSADHSKGVVVFVKAKAGAMVEASIGGQRFTYEALPK